MGNNCNFLDINVGDLIPQRPPFVLVDQLLHCDEKSTRTRFKVGEGTLFAEEGSLSETGIVENIAQTCAVRMGYINQYLRDKPVAIGFIGAIRDQEFTRLPRQGEVLETEIETLEEVFQTTLVKATVRIGEEIISSCEMKIAITNPSTT